ncbi:DNA-3-methyladenine glycosylase [Nocardioides marmorisolisilvae]|uniref:Putative 3-methyladenine DNA glycosylase n=1 Tax=Nocardioides marmorisolisilvae TaxID=1542737 RepID=A0A3N0DUG0_9ACTN|nr:DNA-3-methyladenine glycosylase [Nocardioides marmorisolisilvae]RNL79267.1 DNA-3-methyladenine glycosylase [Nocardioides marmorisolisilvae]
MATLADVLAGPVLEVAPRLLGATLRHGDVAVRLTEVEAYDGTNDPGSHAANGPTPRNEIMFGPPGFLYVYFIYGMHHCANVVCGPDGHASAVLLRAGEVVEGVETARARRTGSARDLARGPARLCDALAIDLRDKGTSLVDGPVRLELGDPLDTAAISTGPRVGLRPAAERPWRFWITEDPTVSRYVPAKPRSRTTN